MNVAHVHLLLNHVPIIGMGIVALLLCMAFAIRHEQLARLSLGMTAVFALVGVAVYFTGEGAEGIVEHLPGVTESAIHEHEEMAEATFIALAVAGAAAIGVLIGWRRKVLSQRVIGLSVLGSLAVAGMLAYTAYLGGHIRHTEIRPDAGTVIDPEERDR